MNIEVSQPSDVNLEYLGNMLGVHWHEVCIVGIVRKPVIGSFLGYLTSSFSKKRLLCYSTRNLSRGSSFAFYGGKKCISSSNCIMKPDVVKG